MSTKIKHQLRSFKWAFKGIIFFFSNETKAWMHSIAGILAVTLGFIFHLSAIEWAIITFAIGIVFISEIFNTAIEQICETIPDKYDHIIGRSKDIAAGAVLISAIVAIIIALIIYLPQIINYIKN